MGRMGIRNRYNSVATSFGGLEWVYLSVFFLDRRFQMGGHIALPRAPFGGRIREYHAILASGIVCDFLTALARLNDDMARTAIETAAFLGHEKTILTFLYG